MGVEVTMPSEFIAIVLFAGLFAIAAPLVVALANRVDRHAH
jgi:hypothetical protein